MKLAILFGGVALVILYVLFVGKREEKLSNKELFEMRKKQKSPIWFWVSLFLFCTFIGVLMSQQQS